MPRLGPFVVLAFLAAPSCAGDAEFSTRYAPNFPHARHTISVLGVFKDGSMSSDAWDQIGPRLSTPFGATCTTAYGALVGSNQGLSSAIDDYVRANGIGDDLLEQLAPAATGDLILVVMLAGRPGSKPAGTTDTSGVSGGVPSTAGGRSRGGMMGGAGGTGGGGATMGNRARQRVIIDGAAFEMSASLYSVSMHQSVGIVSLQYSGPTVDDAVARMAARLGIEIPASTCGGWNLSVPIDEHRIRGMVEQ
jgi:hypothetical protein